MRISYAEEVELSERRARNAALATIADPKRLATALAARAQPPSGLSGGGYFDGSGIWHRTFTLGFSKLGEDDVLG